MRASTPAELEDTSEKRLRGETIDSSISLSMLHHSAVAPGIKPMTTNDIAYPLTERKWRLALECYPCDLAGVIDIDTGDALRDTKTSSKSPSKSAAANSLQLGLYSLAKETLDGAPPKETSLDYLVALKTAPKFVRCVAPSNPFTIDSILRRVESWHRMIESGVFAPCDPSEWVCSAKWCGYYNDVCPYGRKGRITHGRK